MIVACEHCGSRYSLDESKMPGRGARVTCPNCSHVFVVYRESIEDAGGADGIELGEEPEVSPQDVGLCDRAHDAHLSARSGQFRKAKIWKSAAAQIGRRSTEFREVQTVRGGYFRKCENERHRTSWDENFVDSDSWEAGEQV